MNIEQLGTAKRLQDEYYSTWDMEEQTLIAHKFMAGFSELLIKQAEYVQKLKENKHYREAIKKAIAAFNQDEHPHGMSLLLKALERGSNE